MNKAYTDPVVVYAQGIVYASVCAESTLTGEEVTEWMNSHHPTGILSQWSVDAAGVFSNGDPMPRPCDDGNHRTHWLLTC